MATMNIKDPRVHAMAHELAALRRSSATAAVREALEEADTVQMSADTVLELAIVTRASGPTVVDRFVEGMGVRVLPVDDEQLRWARVGLERFGRGSGSPARLTYGDCFAYAAAMATDEPLLFKGDDFTHTDVRPALPGRPG